MKTTDETILTAQEVTEEGKNIQKNSKSQTWKPVSIGGMTGILMGAAGMYAAETMAADSREGEAEETAEGIQAEEDAASAASAEAVAGDGSAHAATAGSVGVPVAEVNQDLSFAHAFAEAREQVGAGGVFVWHGNVYNTFTADEWAGMDGSQRHDFAQSVQPLVSVSEQTAQYASTHTVHDGTGQQQGTSDEAPEVHFLGVETQETDNGQNLTIGHMTVDDVHVALVDVDDDHVFDVGWIDSNQNEEVEVDELHDISDAGMTVQDFSEHVQEEQMAEGHLEQAMNSHEELAPDMPDYMNDVNTHLL